MLSLSEMLEGLESRSHPGPERRIKTLTQTYELPSGAVLTVVDYRTFSHMDERDYKTLVKASAHESLSLRRGVAAIYEGASVTVDPLFVLAGLPKFGYIGEDLTLPPDLSGLRLVRSVFCTKENGEACHLSFFPVAGKWHACVGSKNVHIPLSVHSIEEAEADLAHYQRLAAATDDKGKPTNPRIAFATKNAELLLSLYGPRLTEDDAMRRELFEAQQTIVFEAVFDDHIVDYGGRNAAIALAITRPQLAPLSSQGLSEPPLAAFERLGRWGFELPRHGVASTPDEVAALKAEFETCQNSEGAVVYEEYAEIYRGNAPGDADAAGGASSSSSAAPTTRVLAIYKHKNFVYIMRRMARELVKRKAGFGGWRRRWAECHVPVEGSEQLARERDMLLAFYCWLARTKQLSAKPSEICRRYAGAYKSGAAAASAAGAGQGAAAAAAVAVPLTSWEECVQRLFKAILKAFHEAVPEGQRTVTDAEARALLLPEADGRVGTAVMLVGLQGSGGKSTIREIIVDALPPGRAIGVNQDELGGHRRPFIAGLEAALKRSTGANPGGVVVVDKCNHTRQLREDVYSRFRDVLVVVLDDGGNPARLLARVRARGHRHPTLTSGARAAGAIEQFCEAFEPVGEAEAEAAASLGVLSLDAFAPPEENASRVLRALRVALLRNAGGGGGEAAVDAAAGDGEEAAAEGAEARAAVDLLVPEEALRVTAEAAARVIAAHEAKMETLALKLPQRWRAVACPGDVRDAVRGIAPALPGVVYKWDDAARELAAEEEYHVTLVYAEVLSAEEAQAYREAGAVTARIDALVFDSRCAALRVAAEGRVAELCRRGCPHVTLGWNPAEVKPVYAGEMVQRSLAGAGAVGEEPEAGGGGPVREVSLSLALELVVETW